MDDGPRDTSRAGDPNPEAAEANRKFAFCGTLESGSVGVETDEAAVLSSENAVDGSDLTCSALDLVEVSHDELFVGGGDLEAVPAWVQRFRTLSKPIFISSRLTNRARYSCTSNEQIRHQVFTALPKEDTNQAIWMNILK